MVRVTIYEVLYQRSQLFLFLVCLNLRVVETKLWKISANIVTPPHILFFASPLFASSVVSSCSSLLSLKYYIPAETVCKSNEIIGSWYCLFVCVYVCICVFSHICFFSIESNHFIWVVACGTQRHTKH